MFSDPKSDYDRGRENGSKVQSAADEAAEIVTRFIQTDDYVAGYEQSQTDRAEND